MRMGKTRQLLNHDVGWVGARRRPFEAEVGGWTAIGEILEGLAVQG